MPGPRYSEGISIRTDKGFELFPGQGHVIKTHFIENDKHIF